MDSSDWTNIRNESFPSLSFGFGFGYEPESNYSNYVVYVRVWEQTALNEQACAQARRIMLGEEFTEILNLEKDVVSLEEQLAWADVTWSAFTDSVPLSERVKILNMSIRSLKNENSEDDHISGERLMLQRELVERWESVLKHLPEKYLPQKAIQASDLIMKEPVLASLQPESESIAGKKTASCYTPETVRKEEEVKGVINFNSEESVRADKHESAIMMKKSDFSCSAQEIIKKEVEECIHGVVTESVSADLQPETGHIMEVISFSCSILENARKGEETKELECADITDVMSNASVHVIGNPEKLKKPDKFELFTNGKGEPLNLKAPTNERGSFLVWSPSLNPTGKKNSLPGMMKPASELTSDDTKRAIGSEVKNELTEIDSNEDVLKEIKSHISSDSSICLTAALLNREKEYLSEKVQFAGHISESVSSGLCRVSEDTDKDETGSKGSKSYQKTENEETNAQGIEVPGTSLSNAETNKSDTLLEFYNKKREQSKMNSKDRDNQKSKKVKVESQKPKGIEVFKQKVKVENNLFEPKKRSINSPSKRQAKRKPQNLPNIERVKKLKGSILALLTNSAESPSLESVCSNNLAVNDTCMEEIPTAPPRVPDLEKLRLADLKDVAKLIKLEKYSKFTKPKLIEQITLKLMTRDEGAK